MNGLWDWILATICGIVLGYFFMYAFFANS